jgi:hypothetical protein
MKTKTIKLTDRAKHLIGEISAGRNRLWAMDDAPPGWLQLERAGLAERVACTGGHAGNDRAKLTASGQLLACVEYPPLSRIAQLCQADGCYPIAQFTGDPADVLPRVLSVLRELAPAAHAAVAIPTEALTDGGHEWWNGPVAEQAIAGIIEALNANAPEGFAIIIEADHIGFYPHAGEAI